jgi:hypothetical protein
MSTHENFSREESGKLPSNRSVGVVFGVVFLLLAFLPSLLKGADIQIWALLFSLFFFLAGVLNAPFLTPLNRVWMKFGLLLHRIVSPVVLGIIFISAVLPTRLLLRLAGKDPLRLEFDPGARSYWIVRTPPGPKPESMRHQF